MHGKATIKENCVLYFQSKKILSMPGLWAVPLKEMYDLCMLQGVLHKSLRFFILTKNCVELENVIKACNCKKKLRLKEWLFIFSLFCVLYLIVSATIWAPVYRSSIECVRLIVFQLEISKWGGLYSSLAFASQESITALLISRFSHQAWIIFRRFTSTFHIHVHVTALFSILASTQRDKKRQNFLYFCVLN